ncbi:MAG TPA: hypothetical protein VGM93_11860 [Acidimicrobiales bacterium]
MSNASQVRAFSNAFRSARQGAGYTLQDLTDEVAETDPEASLETFTAWEGGKAGPREWERPTVEAVERALGVEGTLVDALGW